MKMDCFIRYQHSSCVVVLSFAILFPFPVPPGSRKRERRTRLAVCEPGEKSLECE